MSFCEHFFKISTYAIFYNFVAYSSLNPPENFSISPKIRFINRDNKNGIKLTLSSMGFFGQILKKLAIIEEFWIPFNQFDIITAQLRPFDNF